MNNMANDVSRAYSYAPAIRPVHVQLAEGDRELLDHDKCGRLNVSAYGTRGVALNLHERIDIVEARWYRGCLGKGSHPHVCFSSLRRT